MIEMWNRPVTPAEEAAIAAFLTRVANTPPGTGPRLPAADVVWLKAQLLRRWEAERTVQTPLDVMEPVQFAAGLAAAAMLVAWPLMSWMESLVARVP